MVWEKTGLDRSYVCNVDMLVQLRKRMGWTQADLARVSGYTERLISKAESGKSISPATVDDLADALSPSGAPVYPEDLISDPVSLAKKYVFGVYVHQKNIVSEVRHFLDEDIVLKLEGDPATIPFAGTHRGIVELEQAYEVFWSLMEVPQNHDHKRCYSFSGQGNLVFAHGDSHIHPKGTPLGQPMPMSQRFSFRRGLLVELHIMFDTQAGARVLERHDPDADPTSDD